MVAPSDPAQNFAALLRGHRVAARLTQEQLAERAGLNVRSVSQLERGKVRYPRSESVRLLGQALELAPEDLAEFTEVARSEWWADHNADSAPATEPATSSSVVKINQLPGDIPGFTGRKSELQQLNQLGERAVATSPSIIGVVSGAAGVGKTTLALHWAHQVADRFPDGQLYANLRGFDRSGTTADVTDVLKGFLEALGVARSAVPASLEQRAALYRSLLSKRRILVVLDNARDSDQVRPLLPGSGLALITSRHQLTSLAATSGAHLLALEPLPSMDAEELLTARLGAERVAAERGAVEKIVDACGGLPLALAVAAARAQQSSFPLAVLAADLGETAHRLSVLEAGDEASDVRAVFSWSFEAVSSDAAEVFRMLGLHPGPDFTLPAVTALTARPSAEVRRLLAELARASLLSEHQPGRYHLHDLLRVYAAELAATLKDDERQAAITRLVQHYAHTAYSAARRIDPTHDPIEIPLREALPGTGTTPVTDDRQALGWIGGELPSLLAAVHLSAQAGLDDLTWQLAWTLESYLRRQARWGDLRAVSEAGLNAAERLNAFGAQGYSLLWMATVAAEMGRIDDAFAGLNEALERYARAGGRTAQLGYARTHRMIGWVYELQDQHEEALTHVRMSLAGYRAAGHRDGEMFALNAVGWGLTLTGAHAEAVVSCRQALALAEEAGDRSSQAMILDSVALAEHHLGHYASAISCYRQAADIFRELANPRGEGSTLARLADTQVAAGELNAAGVTYQQALHLLSAQNHPDTEPVRKRFADLPRLHRNVSPS